MADMAPAMASGVNTTELDSLVFDQSGILWFTVQQANMVGRLDPKTADIKLVTSPTPGSRPYGIRVNSEGIPFFVEFGTQSVSRWQTDRCRRSPF